MERFQQKNKKKVQPERKIIENEMNKIHEGKN